MHMRMVNHEDICLWVYVACVGHVGHVRIFTTLDVIC